MDQSHPKHNSSPYGRLALMAVLSYVAMYVLMYAMVDRLDHVFHNVNQVYMAGLMTSPMIVIELALMRAMYTDRRRNGLIIAASIAFGVVMWMGIREQLLVRDKQFLRSMIPHHAGAILMCREAQISSAELSRLCQEIIRSQQAEIDLMRGMLAR